MCRPAPRLRRGFGGYRLEAGRAGEALTDFEAALKLNANLEPTLRPHIERARRELEY
jgi:hypothetical protein